jgi:hypothetical protein
MSDLQAQLQAVMQQNRALQQQVESMSQLKKVGMIGSISNAVKSAALGVELISAGVTESAAYGLYKIQKTADLEVQEEDPSSSWAVEKTRAIALARMSFK